MMKFATGITALIAYGGMMETSKAVSLGQADAGPDAADYPVPEKYDGGLAQLEAEQESLNSNTRLPVTFDNETDQTVELFWLNFQGQEQSYGTVAPGATKVMTTYATHPWFARGKDNAAIQLQLDGEDVFTPDSTDTNRVIHIDEADLSISGGGASVPLKFKNEASQPVELFWHNYQGLLRSYGIIQAGATKDMWTYVSHPWSAVAAGSDPSAELSVDNKEIFVPALSDRDRTIVIEEFESKSSAGGLVSLTFDNEASQDVDLYWHNYNGDKVYYGRIGNGATRVQGTYATHPWSVVGVQDSGAELVLDGDDIFVPKLSDNGRTIYIGEDGH